jgi:membrane fusion protein, type I secretion system
MSVIDRNQHDRAASMRPSPRQHPKLGLQGKALILELQSAKRAIELNRRGTSRASAPARRRQSAGPEGVVHQFPRSPERLDRFDHNVLQNPIRATQTEQPGVSGSEVLSKHKVFAEFGHYFEILRRQFGWLVSGTPASADSAADFREQVVRTHEIQLKAAARVLIISASIAGGWAMLVPLSGAVVLPGTLVVESSVKKIQHPTGGVVAAIPVEDGMHVNAGTLLLRLDDTQLKANQKLIADQLDQVRVRIARLVAERDGTTVIHFPEQIADGSQQADIAHLVSSETALFDARAKARQGQKDLYASNIRQLQKQIEGLNAEIQSKTSQLALIASELSGVQELYGKGLVPLTRLTTLQRDSAQLEGERAQLAATVAETNAKIGQARLQITQIDQDFRSEVMKDLRESQDKEAELTEKNVAAKDQLDRIEIRAPTSGIVHQLAVHTIGGVIRPGDVIMEIVPDTDDLEIEGHLPPNEIDQVERRQRAYLRFSTLDRPTMPEVRGTVTYVSADLSHDERTNAGFYTVKIDLPEGERHRLDGMTLISGMPVEIFLQTGSRTMLSYLFKPISDQLHRMFNEP